MIQIAFSEVFDRIKQSTGVKNQSELAVLLGCTEMNISRAKKRGKIPAEWLIKLLRSHELIPDWIITGEGPQYLKPDFARGETNVNGNVLFFIANLPTSKGKQITRVIFSDVFKRIQQVTGVKNQSKLAELLGYHDMTISAAKRRSTKSISSQSRISRLCWLSSSSKSEPKRTVTFKSWSSNSCPPHSLPMT